MALKLGRPVRLHEFRAYYASLPDAVKAMPSWLSWDDIVSLLKQEGELHGN